MNDSYSQALQSLYALAGKLPPRQYLLGMRKLLAKLGNPQDDFESIIITGTNGKGSATAMTASALKCAGLKTGRYLSPHIDDFRERICINDEMIPKKRVIELHETVGKASQTTEPVTFFEFLTSMMFQYFSEEQIDCAVLEVGLGGRLDATNLASSRLCAITEIGLDHTHVLGNNLASIAMEKSGVIREKGTIITAERKQAPLSTIASECKKKKARLLCVGKDIRYETVECSDSRNSYLISTPKDTYSVSLSMLGSHQGRNASVAAGLAEQMDADSEAIEQGISEAKLPCRLEVVSRNPTLLMDCAHNPHAAKTLSESLHLFKYNRLILLVGMMGDKDSAGFFKELAPKADLLILNQPDYPRAAQLESLFELSRAHTSKTIGIRNVSASLSLAKSLAKQDDLICAAGSIYMLSQARGNPLSVTQ